jgi:hypothetical protein
MKKILLTTFAMLVVSVGFAQKKQANIMLESPGVQVVDYDQATLGIERVFPMGYEKLAKAQIERQKSARVGKTAKAQVIFLYENAIPQSVKDVFEKAGAVWAEALNSDVPIRILVRWASQANGVLGAAGPTFRYANFPGAIKANTWYGAALAEKMAHKNLNGDNPDIVATFNSNRNDWYIGTDAVPTRLQYDLYSVILHEYGHGLGFVGGIGIGTDGQGVDIAGYSFPYILDSYLVGATGQSLTDTNSIKNPSPELYKAITNAALYMNPPSAVKSNKGANPRMYAPAKYAPGSSVYHVDQRTYPIGDPNALMTPQIAPGELTRELGNITLDAFGDFGWKSTSIVHDPYSDTEDVSKPYDFSAKILSDTTINAGSLKLFLTTDTTIKVKDIKEVALTKKADGSYVYILPQDSKDRVIRYFWTGLDASGKKLTTPAQAPEVLSYKFTLGRDKIPPTLNSFLNNIFQIYSTDKSITIPEGTAFDNIGIDTVYVEYSINGVAQKSFGLKKSAVTGLVRFNGGFEFPDGLLKGGEKVSYRIVIKDKAKIANVTYSPKEGTYDFTVLKLLAPVNTYFSDFNGGANDTSKGDFFTKGFGVTQPNNFKDGGMHSEHPYKDGSEELYTGSTTDTYTNTYFQLLKPIVLRGDTAKIYFDEVVLVEPGDPGVAFGERNFFDYVVVEGSVDGGKSWKPFQDGWDSRGNTLWEKAWLAASVDKDGNSKTVGSATQLAPREVDMLKSGDFKAGDKVSLRFRMLADVGAHGWGWVVDNLNIQGPSGKKPVVVVPPPPVTVANELEENINVAVSPNPSTNGEFVINAKFKKAAGKVQLSVRNMAGIEMGSQAFENIGREFNQVLDLSARPTGVYFLSVNTSEGSIVKKVMFLK